MEFTDNSPEYHQMSNIDSVNLCTSQSSIADSGLGTSSDISRYMTLPRDLHYQRPFPIQYHNDDYHIPVEGSKEKHEKTTVIKQEDIPAATHSRRSSRSSNKLTSDESPSEKRERNRNAANKCRKKQKKANEELKEKARAMDQQHNYLVCHKALLESEMIELKNELLVHGACGCEPISEYLTQAAQRYANGRTGNTQIAEQGSSSANRY
ncbi:hypothetical protein ABKA04_003561 [Annulohypoxylon sp. FPYF3050]